MRHLTSKRCTWLLDTTAGGTRVHAILLGSVPATVGSEGPQVIERWPRAVRRCAPYAPPPPWCLTGRARTPELESGESLSSHCGRIPHAVCSCIRRWAGLHTQVGSIALTVFGAHLAGTAPNGDGCGGRWRHRRPVCGIARRRLAGNVLREVKTRRLAHSRSRSSCRALCVRPCVSGFGRRKRPRRCEP